MGMKGIVGALRMWAALSVLLMLQLTCAYVSLQQGIQVRAPRASTCVLQSTRTGGSGGSGGSGRGRDDRNRRDNSSSNRGDRDRKPYQNKNWKSGGAFKNNNRGRRRNDPWWMREDEATNPRIRPVYMPWWFEESRKAVDDDWKVADLKSECIRRGIPDAKSLKKEQLLQVLKHLEGINSLSDDNFCKPFFSPHKEEMKPSCYPEVYEGGADAVAKLQKKIMLIRAPE